MLSLSDLFPFVFTGDLDLSQSSDIESTLSPLSARSLASNSLSSVEESCFVGSSFGLKFLLFQFVRTNPRAFSKLVAKLMCSFLRSISASTLARACDH